MGGRGELIVRAAEGDEDGAFIRDLGRRVALDSVHARRTADPEIVADAFAALAAFVDGRIHDAFIAAAPDARRLGFLLLVDDLPDEVTGAPQGFVAYMAVEPDVRGKGIGAALLAAAEAAARDRGLPTVSLMVTEDNVRARALYDGAGYVTERRLMTKWL